MNVANSVLWRMAIILKANKVCIFCFVCFLVPFTELFRHTTYRQPCRISGLTLQRAALSNEKCITHLVLLSVADALQPSVNKSRNTSVKHRKQLNVWART
jgi:hypothetical protein